MSHKGKDKRNHWLDYYLSTHDCNADPKCCELKKRKRNDDACQKAQFIDDIKSLLRVLIMYLPVPMFWALYDQQGSVWLIQAIQMNCKLDFLGGVLLLPDQMQTLNAVLILAFIPLFQVIIYPLLSLCVKLTPLRKMVAGGVLASAAFVVSALVQFKINTTLPEMPLANQAFVSVVNGFENCDLNFVLVGPGSPRNQFVKHNTSLTNNQNENLKQLFVVDENKAVSWDITSNGTDCTNVPKRVTYSVDGGNIYFVFVGQMGSYIGQVDPDKPQDGNGEFALAINVALSNLTYTENLALCRKNTPQTTNQYPCDPRQPENFYFYQRSYDDDRSSDFVSLQNYTSATPTSYQSTLYSFKSVRPGSWVLYYMSNTPKSAGVQTMSKEQVKISETGVSFEIEGQGGVFLIAITGQKESAQKHVFQAVPDNTVSILWQVPQIVVITAAEILFSITGYEFAYSQAAPSMKALVQALWLLTTAVGDSIIVLIAALNLFDNMAIEFLAYAGLMLVVIIIFALLSIFYYEYKYYVGDDGDDDEDELEDDETTDDNSHGAAEKKRSSLADSHRNGSHYAQNIQADFHANKGFDNDDDDDVWNVKL